MVSGICPGLGAQRRVVQGKVEGVCGCPAVFGGTPKNVWLVLGQVYKPVCYLRSGCRADPSLGAEQVTAGSCQSFSSQANSNQAKANSNQAKGTFTLFDSHRLLIVV